MPKRTPLYDEHLAAAARMVDFAGWEMPLHYGSQLGEHHQVRRDAGVFDVSHMTVIDLAGVDSRDFLQRLLANDVAKLKTPGKALYTCMLQEDGGVIDDLIVYWLGDDRYRLVVNAATRDKDLAWMRAQAAGFDLTLEERKDLAMLAVQGPKACERAVQALDSGLAAVAQSLSPFTGTESGDWFIARTGYTGEDGYEVLLPADEAPIFWRALLEAGVRPVGLGARDTLRLEAGMNLYGTDMDASVTPLECGLEWTVAWAPAERDFIGRSVLEKQRATGATRRFIGLVLEGRGVLRGHERVVTDAGEGEITSGSFSPTLGVSIGLARVPAQTVAERGEVEIRGKLHPVRLIKPPFVRHGQSCL